jgi:hypothetical protein
LFDIVSKRRLYKARINVAASVTHRITNYNKSFGSIGWGQELSYGFWTREGSWRYDLQAVRFDSARKSDEPPWLAADDLKRLRPLVIAELNRRSLNERRGDQLAQLLDYGAESKSFICIQNDVILLAWLSLSVALLSLIWMFFRPAA